jgi:sugar phosphate permease
MMEGMIALSEEEIDESKKEVTFLTAWCLPNVLIYASAFFFAKYALMGLMYNLPSYLNDVFGYGSQTEANISTCNDVGAIFGSFLIGFVSDRTWGKRSPAAFFAIVMSAVIFYSLTFAYDSVTFAGMCVAFFFFGMFLQAVNNTIAATCSADIGRASCKDQGSTSTVTGIIDGCGTLGASAA